MPLGCPLYAVLQRHGHLQTQFLFGSLSVRNVARRQDTRRSRQSDMHGLVRTQRGCHRLGKIADADIR